MQKRSVWEQPVVILVVSCAYYLAINWPFLAASPMGQHRIIVLDIALLVGIVVANVFIATRLRKAAQPEMPRRDGPQ